MTRKNREIEATEAQDVQDAPDAPADTPAPDAPADDSTEALEGSTDVATDPVAPGVRAWVAAHIAGGPIARDTDCWNALQAALPSLGKFIITTQPQEG